MKTNHFFIVCALVFLSACGGSGGSTEAVNTNSSVNNSEPLVDPSGADNDGTDSVAVPLDDSSDLDNGNTDSSNEPLDDATEVDLDNENNDKWGSGSWGNATWQPETTGIIWNETTWSN